MDNTNSKGQCSTSELLAVLLSREFEDGEIGSAGVNSAIPMAAMRLAQLTRCPNLGIICSYTGFMLNLAREGECPLYPSSFDYRNIYGAESCLPGPEIFYFQRDFFCASGIQIDRFGNVNMAAIGEWQLPKFRGPGSAGIPFVSATANKYFLYFPQQSPKIFVEKVDFISGIGYYQGYNTREQFALPGAGPKKVFTNLGVYDFEPATKSMRLISIHPSVSVQVVVDATGFPLLILDDQSETEAPSDQELSILRTKVDPLGILRG